MPSLARMECTLDANLDFNCACSKFEQERHQAPGHPARAQAWDQQKGLPLTKRNSARSIFSMGLALPIWALMFSASAMMSEATNDFHPPIIDSGATCHLCPRTQEFIDKVVPGSMVRCVKVINTAGSGRLFSTHSATLILRPDGASEGLLLTDVLLVGGLRRMLASVSCLVDDGHNCLFTKLEYLMRNP